MTCKVRQSRTGRAIWWSCIYSTCHTKGDTQALLIWCQQEETERNTASGGCQSSRGVSLDPPCVIEVQSKLDAAVSKN